nr:peptide chain release factor 1-like, mitochondrial isoform X2 [Paramormyrops kingsleyae]
MRPFNTQILRSLSAIRTFTVFGETRYTRIYYGDLRCRRFLHTTKVNPAASVLSANEIFKRKSLQDYLRKLESEYVDCLRSVDLNSEDLKWKRNRITHLTPLIDCVKKLAQKQKEYEEIQALLKDDDLDIRKLAENEKIACQDSVQDLRKTILSLLIPAEKADDSDLVLEVTAGVGGQEAMLFTAEMFDMYRRFANYQGWDFETLEYNPSDTGGLRHGSAAVSGPQSYKTMKFEAGVHRVQRVPKTEKQGRIHTSTMTVAVLPQPTEITLTINAKDLKIETKRASGAGGQHVNTTDSAVRIVHIPTDDTGSLRQPHQLIR